MNCNERGEKMAYEILKTIVEAEEKGSQIKIEAQQQANTMKKEAQERKDELLDSSQAQGKKTLDEARDEAKKESLSVIKEIETSTQETCLNIRKQAQTKQEEAIEAVIRRVVGNYGSS